MLIEWGDVKRLRGKGWAGVELVSEARTEEVVLHISRWAMRSLDEPFQLLFPIKTRSVTGVTLLTPYLWARTTRLLDLDEMRKSVMGVQGLVRDGQGVLEIEDEFVQDVIKTARKVTEEWNATIKRGSFVRVLLGDEHGLCGTVLWVHGGMARVKVALKSRELVVQIPVRALENLGKREEREYYYV